MLARPCSVYHCEHRCSQASKRLSIRHHAFRREVTLPRYVTRYYHNRARPRYENVQDQDVLWPMSAEQGLLSSLFSVRRLQFRNPASQTRPLPDASTIPHMGRIPLQRGFTTSCLYNSAIQRRLYTSHPTTLSETSNVYQLDQDTYGNQNISLENNRFSPGAENSPKFLLEKAAAQNPSQKPNTERSDGGTGQIFPPLSSPLRSTFRELINKAIASTARKTRRHLIPSQYHYEYSVRSRCLYIDTLIHPDWNENFGLVFSHKVRGENMETVWDKLKLDHEEDALEWLTGVDWTAEDPTHLARKWSRVHRRQKETLWPPIALWLLLNSPRASLAFLLATDVFPAPPFSMVAKCFLYLDAFHYEELTRDERSKQHYHEALRTCLNPEKWPVLKAYERGIRLFLKRSAPEDLNKALSTIIDRRIFIGFETATYLMDLFTKRQDIPRALSSLGLITDTPDYTRFLSDPRVQQRCCKLLTLDHVIEENDDRYFRILPEILKIGVPLNQPMLNIIYRNALKQKVPASVPHVLHEMGEKGIPPDSYTYISLLDDAVSRRDLQHLDVIIREISSQESLRKNPFITSKLLHVFYSLDRVNPDEGWGDADVFGRMLNIYSAAHDVQPLVDLGVVRVDEFALEEREVSGNPPPSSHALVIMIAAFLRMQNRRVVNNIFDRFINLRDQGHESFGPLAESDYIYNVFVQEFARRHSGRMRNCVRVLDKMLQPLPATAVLRSQNNRQLEQVKPTVQTWTIILTAFIRDRHPNAIEKIRSMMQEQGLKFNEVTWNVAVAGFSTMQMVDETANAVNAMMKEGWALDEYTLNSMGWIHDRDRLLALVDNVATKIPDHANHRLAEGEGLSEPVEIEGYDEPVESQENAEMTDESPS
ncbi:pentatricopeptide repeat protein [Blastomyces dermatitidis ER-3]|uniref:Pentatricopeptide repeat protein n=1 Tax=Ajellomyces dermatitidis (strain ER-3 / ATCC MYA-2586) TaxID=559297 RepID=A0ABP2EVB6_AJEDR|nr:pentatricopeptide repeat protein [Blastomyces dermatitidis ER-3]EEQ86893.2 pentatricopeptide repeat protein [Blastomyces dermatitidis ER-3]